MTESEKYKFARALREHEGACYGNFKPPCSECPFNGLKWPLSCSAGSLIRKVERYLKAKKLKNLIKKRENY